MSLLPPSVNCPLSNFFLLQKQLSIDPNVCSHGTEKARFIIVNNNKHLPSSLFYLSLYMTSLLLLKFDFWQTEFEIADGLCTFGKLICSYWCTHQWCYITGLWVSNPFCCDQHALFLLLHLVKYTAIYFFFFWVKKKKSHCIIVRMTTLTSVLIGSCAVFFRTFLSNLWLRL